MTLPSIPQAPSLPAHLSDFGDFGFSLNESVVGGLNQGGGHPSIGIKQARFRIREGANEEVVNSFTLKVIIVNANKHLSKVFYAGAYTGEEGKAPDCFSDNGIGPSSKSSAPQSNGCAACPHNVWGSKITVAGTKIKSCSDYKKLAVVLADDPERNVYELRVPGASLKELNTIMSKLIINKVPIPAIVFEISFDSTVDYPKLAFKPLTYVDEYQAGVLKTWVNSDEAKQVVGENDVPIQTTVAQSYTSAALPPGGQANTPRVPAAAAIQHAPTPQQADPMAFLNSEPAQASQAPRGRGRPPKATTQEPTQLSLDLPGMQAAAQSTPINPATTDANLDALLDGIL